MTILVHYFYGLGTIRSFIMFRRTPCGHIACFRQNCLHITCRHVNTVAVSLMRKANLGVLVDPKTCACDKHKSRAQGAPAVSVKSRGPFLPVTDIFTVSVTEEKNYFDMPRETSIQNGTFVSPDYAISLEPLDKCPVSDCGRTLIKVPINFIRFTLASGPQSITYHQQQCTECRFKRCLDSVVHLRAIPVTNTLALGLDLGHFFMTERFQNNKSDTEMARSIHLVHEILFRNKVLSHTPLPHPLLLQPPWLPIKDLLKVDARHYGIFFAIFLKFSSETQIPSPSTCQS